MSKKKIQNKTLFGAFPARMKWAKHARNVFIFSGHGRRKERNQGRMFSRRNNSEEEEEEEEEAISLNLAIETTNFGPISGLTIKTARPTKKSFACSLATLDRPTTH